MKLYSVGAGWIVGGLVSLAIGYILGNISVSLSVFYETLGFVAIILGLLAERIRRTFEEMIMKRAKARKMRKN